MRKIKKQFSDSARELKKVNTLVIAALLIALGIVLTSVTSFQITPNVKVGISFVAAQLTSLLFGPVVGGIAGGVGDILKFFIKSSGDFSFLWTLNAIVGQMIYGMMLYKKQISFWRILVSKAVVAIVVNIGMYSCWMMLLYGKTLMALLPVKCIQEVIQVPIQSLIFYFFVKALQKTKVFPQLNYKISSNN